jgi:hypothetical protein
MPDQPSPRFKKTGIKDSETARLYFEERNGYYEKWHAIDKTIGNTVRLFSVVGSILTAASSIFPGITVTPYETLR